MIIGHTDNQTEEEIGLNKPVSFPDETKQISFQSFIILKCFFLFPKEQHQAHKPHSICSGGKVSFGKDFVTNFFSTTQKKYIQNAPFFLFKKERKHIFQADRTLNSCML